MNKVLSFISILLLFCSCQQRYWHVKKVKVHPISTKSASISKIESKQSSISPIDSTFGRLNPRLLRKIPRVPSYADHVSIEDPISPETAIIDKIKKEHIQLRPRSLIPPPTKLAASDSFSNAELLFALCTYTLSTLACASVGSAIYYIALCTAMSLSSLMLAFIASILIVFIGLLVLWSMSFNSIERTLQKELPFIIAFCCVIIASLVAIGLFLILLQNVLLSAFLAALILIMTSMYVLKFTGRTKKSD